MLKGRDRNTPCWCGSGKKFKKCHLNRIDQPRDNPWSAVNANKRAFNIKKCCAYDVGLGHCEGGVIKAHTVSRGANLSAIGKNGHVLQYAANIPKMNKNGGRLSVEKIGLREASIFYGFCSKHDRELFSCIENEPFTGRPDQCLTVAYRTMSRELYGKDAGKHLRETLREADRGLSIQEQVMHQEILNLFDRGNEAARREIQTSYKKITKAVVDGRHNILKSVIFEISAPLPFMFAGAWSPFTDLHGKKLQNGYVNEILEQIIVSSFVTETGSMICFSWRDIEGAPGSVIAKQIKLLKNDQKVSSCLQLVMKHVENVFFNPDWFSGLSSESREQLDRLASDGINTLGSIPSIPIVFDLDFELPSVLRSFEV